MRMKKLLMFFVMVCISIGMQAQEPTWTDGTHSVTITNHQFASSDTYQKIVVNQAGSLAAYLAAYSATPPNDVKPHQRIDATRVNLQIEGPLNEADLAALKSANVSFKRPVEGQPGVEETVYPLASITSLDLKNATFDTSVSMAGMAMANLKYLRLPSNFNTVESMSGLNTNNPNLEVALSTDVIEDANKIVINSYQANGLYGASSVFIDSHNNGYNGFWELQTVKYVTMSGTYGDRDLVNGTSKIFGTPAVWDFTGATFTPYTIDSYTFPDNTTHYAIDDPFQDPDRLTGIRGLSNYSTNSFYLFNYYAQEVVDIKLPTGITELPPTSLSYLAKNNKENYKTVYGLTEEDFKAQFGEGVQCAPIETLTIPNNYVILDYDCALRANINHLYVGNGLKEARGGAFANSTTLQDLDFAAGLSNCKIGDLAFGESHSMKHIALSEGIVSLGANAFSNSQHLESIRLPQSLIYIGNSAFNNCLALNSITIPENVEQIGQQAFALCPFTDIYLTTTDPDKIPLIWSAGTGEGFIPFDGNCTFNHGHIDGWEGGLQEEHKALIQTLTFDEAADIYYMHWNGMPVLHYPEELAEKVRAQISSTYAFTSTDHYGLPDREDMLKRSNIAGADLGTSGVGKYTKDGWAQFMLMKAFTTDPGGDVYPKYYEDVWYTMCFPFDLTDEQLAAAFNETFNIVDFSGVEVTEETETDPLTLTLHFNTVAKTYYRDNEGNEYEVIGREKDPASGFNYNIYSRGGVEYHHSQVSPKLSSNKTKTFAPGNSISESNANKDQAIFIDGYLATAGHPYMIHPAIGTALGNPQRCDFSGINWKPMTQWTSIFEAQKRVVDLGVAKGNPATKEADADNYMQAAYSDYEGQTYTFIGNATQYGADCPEEPYEGHGLTPLPDVSNYTTLYPFGPAEPVDLTEPDADEVMAAVGARMTAADEPTEPTQGANPALDTETYPTEFQAFYNSTYQVQSVDYLVGEGILKWSFTDVAAGPYNWGSIVYQVNDAHGGSAFKAYFDPDNTSNNTGAILTTLFDEAKFNTLKAKCQDFHDALEPYINFDALHAQWEINHQAWQDNIAAWNQYDSDLAAYNAYDSETAWATYRTAKQEYDDAVQEWKDDCADVEAANKVIHDAWEANAEKYQKLIPTGAYFLGRRGTDFPKYYREIASDTRPVEQRTGGFWTQFTAVIIPNAAAIAGIETKLGPGIANNTKALNMVFDEGFMGEFNPSEIKDVVAEAEEKGQKVEYMNIVYSINGEIVGRGSQSLNNLPQGMYIINGKKYLVK